MVRNLEYYTIELDESIRELKRIQSQSFSSFTDMQETYEQARLNMLADMVDTLRAMRNTYDRDLKYQRELIKSLRLNLEAERNETRRGAESR